MSAPESTLLFDGKCGFCTRSVMWLLARVREPVHAVPYQTADLDRFSLTATDVRRAAWWIDPDGKKHGGHMAAARCFKACGGLWGVVGFLLWLPPIRWASALGYRLIAKYRRHLPGTTPACRREWDGRASGA